MAKTIRGFKGYNKGLVCNNKQYEIGKTFTEPIAKICEKGMHFCENPFDVLNYYNLIDSEFTEVESNGKTDKQKGKDKDSKVCSTSITIGIKLDLKAFVNASVEFLLKHCSVKGNKKTTNDYSQLASSGDSSQLASSGDSSKLASSGHYSQLASSGDSSKLASSGHSSKLEINGKHSIGANIGISGVAKGKIGNWLVLAEWNRDSNNKWIPINVLAQIIDGKNIEEDTWYELVDGKFTKA
jgi:hypothetical protein